jgi:hypothetical protein
MKKETMGINIVNKTYSPYYSTVRHSLSVASKLVAHPPTPTSCCEVKGRYTHGCVGHQERSWFTSPEVCFSF